MPAEAEALPGESGLAAFNAMSDMEAATALRDCCTSTRWIDVVATGRPYRERDDLFATSDRAVDLLGREDLDEALAGHPRIGDRPASGTWSASEQRGMASASTDVQERIVAGNRAYEEMFGHVYLVCASGKSAEELLSILTSRLGNDPETERVVVMDELAKINRIRLANLLDQLDQLDDRQG
ncbi:2-oxo-4-hydroxy-4-carboxy-5-ureidoimidazoline decarboxylase [Actinobacteria bacterium YIM 96077]|uniref:2-oxo-4-hydroxy-4-carboxy-5-ureidoimidazoline decarboxylase n=1 Tax=Phytoactinopolyspora halophila TaxID=1981511 RepID=A0A329R0Q3_9ACTN|nr:2-oxo-4-hydroxy-4-carboxy-5-ureidoimidazoline decarboxylase [Phytoactinopolyspora halophila]AYY15151.1 2-oxo-4-hydroxy-4-carboxy-5-ureidoimidazoline decarboxylase [Actinobacteria bacterium YIM 96077]RAW18175.1 2-oxo-4-hydroxy-4-carboxy-5-ureidoimidazoline decarboxylase [Phytoactinopolyspora halophila]